MEFLREYLPRCASDVLEALEIQPLHNDPVLLDTLAGWHHQECERQGLQSQWALRRTRLLGHLTPQAIPATFVARVAGAPVGCVSLVNYAYPAETAVDPDAPVWLCNLYVTPACRRQGVASALMSTCVTYVRDCGYKELWLSAREHTDFYRMRGWQVMRNTRLGGAQVNVMCLPLGGESSRA